MANSGWTSSAMAGGTPGLPRSRMLSSKRLASLAEVVCGLSLAPTLINEALCVEVLGLLLFESLVFLLR
jgi:hypothetical protein